MLHNPTTTEHLHARRTRSCSAGTGAGRMREEQLLGLGKVLLLQGLRGLCSASVAAATAAAAPASGVASAAAALPGKEAVSKLT
eukprot:575708-Pelagomonas_calceolata.AAC.2